MTDWKFNIGDRVSFKFGSQPKGEVIGRAEYENGRTSYLVRTANGHGEQVEDWHDSAALNKGLA